MTQSADFSEIDSLSKVIDLAGKGLLEPLYLLPLEFGGARTAENTVYVPAAMAEAKRMHDAEVVTPLIQQGLVSAYQAIPAYSGKSFVPCSIKIESSGIRQVNFELVVWSCPQPL